MTSRRTAVRRTHSTRHDGMATRQQLLQSAGEAFADKGYAGTTSKEICQRANANTAAVNYHFGSKEKLYAAVLKAAHSHLLSVDSPAVAAQNRSDPLTGLRTFIGRIVGEITRRHSNAWQLRVLSRELLSPSPMRGRMVDALTVPSATLFRTTVAEIMQLPAEHSAVSGSIANVMGVCIFMLTIPYALRRKALPDLDVSADKFADDMVTFVLAGMLAAANDARSRRMHSAVPGPLAPARQAGNR